MNNKGILEKAIQKAIDGGLKHSSFPKGIEISKLVTPYWEHSYKMLIFNNDFANCLWPNEWERRYKLAMMVNSEDPLKYLGDNI